MDAFNVVAWFASLLFVSAFASMEEEVIHLDLSPLRMQRGEVLTAQPPTAIGEEDAGISPKNVSAVSCSDSTFPSDIFCDVSSFNRRHVIVGSITTDFYFKYPHPTRPRSECFVSFLNRDESSPSRLEYKSFACYDLPESNSSTPWLSNVEWKIGAGEISAVPDSSLPAEGLKVSDMAWLEFQERGTQNPSLKCKHRLRKASSGGESSPASSVTFDPDLTTCISSAPPPIRRPEDRHSQLEAVQGA